MSNNTCSMFFPSAMSRRVYELVILWLSHAKHAPASHQISKFRNLKPNHVYTIPDVSSKLDLLQPLFCCTCA